MPRVMRGHRHLAVVCAAGLAAVSLSACSLKRGGDNLINGKTAFVAKCGACHMLNRAGTTGVTGPNLDEAFQRATLEGFGRSTLRGLVRHQISYPGLRAQVDPKTKKVLPLMPADLVAGSTADDVAAYVAYASARPGKDAGRLAEIGVKKAAGVAKTVSGELDIPIAPSGLAYTFAAAEAPAGTVKLVAKNPQNVPHNIAVEGNGVNQAGPVIQGGATSDVTVDLKPGVYTFFCSVPGHREGGMVGKLTVK
jgi:plastocyanin